MDEDMEEDKNNGNDDYLMSQSLVSLSGVTYRRKRHPELTPVMPRERFFLCSASRMSKDNNCSKSSTTDGELMRTTTPKRAVSMTRLDQLAKPRRRYVEESLKALNSGNTNHLTKSMSNLTNKTIATHLTPHTTLSPPLHSLLIRKGMFTSMTQLSAHHRAKYSASNKSRTNNSSSFNTNKQLSKSMVQLSAKPTPPPRPTRASKLRTQLTPDSNARDNNLTSSIRSTYSALSPTEVTKDVVKMRAKPTVPRKPRPVTIGSFNVDRSSDGRETPNRGSRSTEKRVQSSQPTPALRSSRARSAGASLHKLSVASPDSDSSDFVTSAAKPTPPRKPAHVKAAAMAKKAVKQIDIITTSVGAMDVNGNEDKELIDFNGKEVSDEKVAESVPLIEPKESEPIKSPSVENSDNVMPSSKKEISEEDYKKMMAEKRKQAREQAEREAELERQRIENERLEELERQRKEEEEQKRLEEEQLRLLEEQKQLEEERLRKAMEESRIREEIENKRKEEEARARVEKEEKERKAKEESERQRIELEERLKKDEEERLARKKKLEAIMSRTRKTTPNARGSSPSNSPNETPEPQLSDSTGSSPEKMREEANNYQNILKNDIKDEQLVIIYK